MFKPVISIDGHNIGEGCSPYIVAELSANHNGSIDKAKSIISKAAECGANAVKLQTYTPDTLTIDSEKEDFLIKGGLWDGFKLYDLYAEAYTPFEWHKELFEHAKKIGVTCFSSPFDESAVDLLEDLNTPAYKIASFEAIDLPLIKYAASTRKPLIISTGMANLEEIEELVDTVNACGCKDLILLHCISAYPAPANESNLQTLVDLRKKFGCIVGLSDHTLGTTVSIASVALGASFIEKHFTLDRSEKGPDSSFSLEPEELKTLCIDSNIAWQAIGTVDYSRKQSEKNNLVFRRSIYFTENIQKGSFITSENIRRIRPGYGLPPKYYDQLLGRKVNQDVTRGDPVVWDVLE